MPELPIIDAEFEIIEPRVDAPSVSGASERDNRGLTPRQADFVDTFADLMGIAGGFAVLFYLNAYFHAHPHWPFH